MVVCRQAKMRAKEKVINMIFDWTSSRLRKVERCMKMKVDKCVRIVAGC